jgi:hypothetical protein
MANNYSFKDADNNVLTAASAEISAVHYPKCILTDASGNVLSLATEATLAVVRASLEIMDDWDETNRCAVNLVAGQAGVAAGSGAVDAKTLRITHASDDGALAVLGSTSDAKVTTDAPGSLSAKMRGMVALLDSVINANSQVDVNLSGGYATQTILNQSSAGDNTYTGTITDANKYRELSVFLDVTSATAGTLDVFVETQDPASSNWVTIAQFAQVTSGTGTWRLHIDSGIGNAARIRTVVGSSGTYSFTVGGVLKI